MAALPHRALHMGQPHRGEAPTLPSLNTRVVAATSTSPGRKLSRNRNLGPTQDLYHSRTVVAYNI
jgi:hypothetical protein